MIDFAWVLHVIRHPEFADAETQPFVDEFNADPAAFDAKYRVLYPKEQGAIDALYADLGS